MKSYIVVVGLSNCVYYLGPLKVKIIEVHYDYDDQTSLKFRISDKVGCCDVVGGLTKGAKITPVGS